MDLRIGERFPQATPQRLTENKQNHLLLNQLQRYQHQYKTLDLHSQIKQRTSHQNWEPERGPDRGENLNFLWNKDKCQQSAVASSEVKQRLQAFVLKKQQGSLKAPEMRTPIVAATAAPPTPGDNYKSLPPDPLPSSSTSSSTSPAYEGPPSDSGEVMYAYPLRKTASEPNLKVRLKLKQRATEKRRAAVLRRKDSAPAGLRRRPPESADGSPNRSRSHSGAESTTGSTSSENGTASDQIASVSEATLAQRLLMQEGPLFRLALPNLQSLPSISQGLPTSLTSKGLAGELGGQSVMTLRSRPPVPEGAAFSNPSPVTYLPTSPQDREGAAASLQPLVIIEPTVGQSSLLAVPGLGAVPVYYAHPLVSGDPYAPRLLKLPQHRPLGRTQSAPLPQNPRSVQQHLYHQLQHQLLLERLKQQTHLGQLMLKRKVTPSEEGEASPASERAPPSRGAGGPQRVSETRNKEGATRHGPQEGDGGDIQQPSLLWDHPWIHQPHLLGPLETLGGPYPGRCHRPLSRARSSPASASLPTPVPENPTKGISSTGLVYDTLMLKHQCTCGKGNHPEHAGRIQSIWSRLQEIGLRSQCESIRGRKATLEELQSVHTEQYVLLYGTNPLSRLKLDTRKLLGILSQKMFVMLACGGTGVDSDTVWNETHSASAARMAAGCVIELAFKVATGKLKNGFAIVRPPGHHAEPSTAMGFCLFNSVAITAKQLLQRSNINKILIVDWDIHHGNGTQQVFYTDPNVLYISIHRHDNGNFFPGSGAPDEVGSGPGEGFNVNIAWTGGLDPPMGDSEYLAAFRTVVIPIANEFAPDLILVSCGFDAVEGHPAQLGGYEVSAKCFGHLTRQLMAVTDGRVVLVLEGGHDLTAICDASEACVNALLQKELESLPEQTLQKHPNNNSIENLERVIQIQSKYWKSVQGFAPTVARSVSESQPPDREERDTVTALASLSVGVTTGGSAENGLSCVNDQAME